MSMIVERMKSDSRLREDLREILSVGLGEAGLGRQAIQDPAAARAEIARRRLSRVDRGLLVATALVSLSALALLLLLLASPTQAVVVGRVVAVAAVAEFSFAATLLGLVKWLSYRRGKDYCSTP